MVKDVIVVWSCHGKYINIIAIKKINTITVFNYVSSTKMNAKMPK